MIETQPNSTISEEQEAFDVFLPIMEQWCKETLPTLQLQWQKSGHIDQKTFASLGALGVLGVIADPQWGGLGLSMWHQIMLMKTLSFYCPSLGLSYLAHAHLCLSQIQRFGRLDQKQRYLPGLIQGTHVGALAISETHAGSDACGMKLKAERKSTQYCLNGHKFWITNAPIADVFVVYAVTDPSKGKNGISAFIIERNTPGFSISKPINKIGMKTSPTAELIFDNCWVDESQLLGELNQGVYIMMKGLDYERLTLSAGPLGIQKRIMHEVLPYCDQRKQFGQTLGDFQLTQQKLATHYTSYHAGYHWLKALSTSAHVSRMDCAAVFLQTAQACVQAALDGIQLFGGMGFTTEMPMGDLLMDAKLYEIGGGTNEIRQIVIGKEMIKYHRQFKDIDCMP